jgi:hypothetical protein
VAQRVGVIGGPVEQEAQPLERPEIARVELERHVPLVERVFVVLAIGQDPGIEVVCRGQVRITLQAAEHDLLRRLELPLPAQGFGQLEEDQAARVGGDQRRQRADVLTHGRSAIRHRG